MRTAVTMKENFLFYMLHPPSILWTQALAGITLGHMIYGMGGQVRGFLELPIPWMWEPKIKRLNDILKITYFGGSQQLASEFLTQGPANFCHTSDSPVLVHYILRPENKMAVSTHSFCFRQHFRFCSGCGKESQNNELWKEKGKK